MHKKCAPYVLAGCIALLGSGCANTHYARAPIEHYSTSPAYKLKEQERDATRHKQATGALGEGLGRFVGEGLLRILIP
jgi:hypothetical protein